ncbi:hypothetical protein JCM8547_004416 [Rhodosporidiobolus lusitaniae]
MVQPSHGVAGVNGRPPHSPTPSTSSSMPAPHSHSLELPFLHEIATHLLAGWTAAEFSDCQLQVQFADGTATVFHLHALVVSQSPLLKSLLVPAFASTPRPVVLLPLLDPSITASSLSLSLASLYSPSVLSHLSPSTAPQVLATASFLGLERLAALAFEHCESACARAATAEEIMSWIAFIERERGNTGGPGGGFSAFPPSSSSTPGPGGPTPPSSLRNGTKNGKSTSPFSHAGSPESRLLALLLTRLVRLSHDLGAFNSETAATTQPQLIEILKRLPFGVFKQVVEDPAFAAPSDMDRFAFAKKVIQARKQVALSGGAGAGGGAGEFEETVVLQFGQPGGDGQCAVNVLRKQRRPVLWKVGGNA